MVQYYTLQEAAAKLRVTAEELKEMAKNGEVRAFQDRGSLRFRAQEVDELARARGFGSDPDLQLGEGARGSAAPRPPAKAEPSVFEFTLGTEDSDEVSLGQDLSPGSGNKEGKKSGQPKSGGPPKTPTAKSPSGSKSPTPGAKTPPSASDS